MNFFKENFPKKSAVTECDGFSVKRPIKAVSVYFLYTNKAAPQFFKQFIKTASQSSHRITMADNTGEFLNIKIVTVTSVTVFFTISITFPIFLLMWGFIGNTVTIVTSSHKMRIAPITLWN